MSDIEPTELQMELLEVGAAIGRVTGAVVRREEGSDAEPNGEDLSIELGPPRIDLPVTVLAERAGLNDVAVNVFRVVAAAELDRMVSRLMRRLAQDPTRPGLEVDAILTVAEGVGQSPLDALGAFDSDAPLLARGLLQWVGGDAGPVL